MIRGNARSLTPALARERARMGRLGAAGCQCRKGSLGCCAGMGAIGDIQADFYTSLQSRVSAAGGQAAAALQAETGVDVTNARVQAGAAAAASLAQNGYNPNDSGDNDKLVAAIAGGCALIPGVGTAIAAAVEALYQVGKIVACPTEQFFASVGLSKLPPQCGGQPCTSSGNWTAAGILASNARELPSMPNGSFAQFVGGALATGAASGANCKGALPPGVIVDAAVRIWNQTHQGPAVATFVPPLNQTNQGIVAFGSPSIITAASSAGGSTPAGRAGKDPNAYYAFGPASAAAQYATSRPPSSGPWQPFAIARPPSGQNVAPPRVVLVNSGAVIAPVGPSLQAGTLENGHTYMMLAPVASGVTQAQIGQFLQGMGFSMLEFLWWGPTSTTSDPKGYLSSNPYAPWKIPGYFVAIGNYTGVTQPSPLAAHDVTGQMSPTRVIQFHLGTRSAAPAATAKRSASLSTGAKVASVAAVGGGGALVWWLASHGWKWVSPRWAARLVK